MDDSSRDARSHHGAVRAPALDSQASTATLLPLASRWLCELPADARPEQLAALFPGIVNKLALTWPEAPRARELLEELLIDRRGGRNGFPKSVFGELLRLHALVGKTSVDTSPGEMWF